MCLLVACPVLYSAFETARLPRRQEASEQAAGKEPKGRRREWLGKLRDPETDKENGWRRARGLIASRQGFRGRENEPVMHFSPEPAVIQRRCRVRREAAPNPLDLIVAQLPWCARLPLLLRISRFSCDFVRPQLKFSLSVYSLFSSARSCLFSAVRFYFCHASFPLSRRVLICP